MFLICIADVPMSNSSGTSWCQQTNDDVIFFFMEDDLIILHINKGKKHAANYRFSPITTQKRKTNMRTCYRIRHEHVRIVNMLVLK